MMTTRSQARDDRRSRSPARLSRSLLAVSASAQIPASAAVTPPDPNTGALRSPAASTCRRVTCSAASCRRPIQLTISRTATLASPSIRVRVRSRPPHQLRRLEQPAHRIDRAGRAAGASTTRKTSTPRWRSASRRVRARHDLHGLHQPERHVRHGAGTGLQGVEGPHARAVRHHRLRARATARPTAARTRARISSWASGRAGRWPAARRPWPCR